MADYIDYALVADGVGHTINGSADFVLRLNFGYRNGTTTSSSQTFGGAALTEQHDESINIAGGGDPTANLSYKVAPALTSQTFTQTWGPSTPNNVNGFAIAFSNVDQVNPIPVVNGSDSATYGRENAPTLTYDAPANSTVFYYKYHATNSASTINAPTGFTLIANHVLLTTPAYRQVSIFSKKVVTAETGVSVGGDTTGSAAVGGVHGFVVLQEPEVLPGIQIGTVDTDDIIEIGQSTIGIVGTGFGATQGTGTLLISPTDDDTDTNARTVTATSWTDILIEFDIPSSFSMLYGNVYLFVTNDSAEVNAAGKELSLVPPAANDYIIIKEQNDLGLLKGVTGLEFDFDQLEYQKTSQGGGNVYIGVSGTLWIDGYPGAVPATEEVYIRLGDSSDQTWSNDALVTIAIGAEQLTRISSDSSIIADILNRLDSDKSISWDLLERLDADKTSSFDILNRIDSDKVAAWDLLERLDSDKSISADIYNRIDSTVSIISDILTRLNSDKSTAWDLLERLDSDASISWEVLSALTRVSSDKSLQYDVINRTDSDAPISWDLLNRISTDKAAVWDLLNRVSSDKAAAWDLLERLDSDASISWELLSALSRISSDKSIQYDLISRTDSDVSISWELLNRIASDKAAVWDLLNRVSTDKAAVWDLLSRVSTDKSAAWDLLERIDSTAALLWEVQSSIIRVSSDASISWDIQQRVFSSLSVSYDILNAVSSDKTILSDILNRVSSDIVQSWDIERLTRVDSDLNISFDLVSRTDSTAVIIYNLGDVVISTPGERVLIVGPDVRTIIINLETRSIVVPPENRTIN